jgi:hypothetical protein
MKKAASAVTAMFLAMISERNELAGGGTNGSNYDTGSREDQSRWTGENTYG